MKRMKKALAGLLALALAAGCAGCGGAPGQSPAPAGSPTTAVFPAGTGGGTTGAAAATRWKNTPRRIMTGCWR